MRRLLLLVALATTHLTAWCAGYPLYVQALQEEEGVYAIVAHNAGAAPVFLSVQLTDRKNVRVGGLYSGGQKALEPGARETIMLAVPENPQEPMSFKYQTKWVFGRGHQRGEHIGVYRPPFQADLTFETLNSAGEEHRGARLQHAVDILMPEGTPVMAARSGYVMDVAGQVGGDQVTGVAPYYEDLSKLGSYVRIYHDDGTWAEYLHLKPGTVTAKGGQRIEAGTQIAESGASGAANRPHMQLNILKPVTGFAEPISLPMRMEMAGRGLVTVRAGDAMGASFSVEADAQTTEKDPLIIAPVKHGEADEKAGVYSATMRLGKGSEQIIFAGLGVAVTLLGGLGIWLIQKRKRAKDWKEVFGRVGEAVSQLRPKTRRAVAAAKAAASERSPEVPTEEINLRPAPGFLVADWERSFLEAVSLAMPIGYAAHPKVALNRLLSRPLSITDDPFALAVLRGESIDVAIVRQRDNRIVAALEIERDYELINGHAKAVRAKRDMLKRAGVRVIELPRDAGVSTIQTVLRQLAPNDLSVAKKDVNEVAAAT